MDPIDMIIEDHQKVKSLFREFEQTGNQAHKTRQKIAEEAFKELEVHATLEEEIFYPAVREKADADGKELVSEAVEEHHVVETLIDEMRQMQPEDEQFVAKFTVLIENVEHHIEEEESEMLPNAREILGDQMDELAERMSSRKRELMQAM